MRGRLEKAGLAYEFIDGIDGRALSAEERAAVYDRRKRLRYFGRDLTPGEVGCLLSHRKIYQKMDREGIGCALVLEDDVVFEDRFRDVVQALVNTDIHWDIIRFVGNEKIYARGCRKIVPLTEEYSLVRLPTAPGGAYGYLLNLHAARTLLGHMRKNWLPVDAVHGRVWETGLETLSVHPAPLYVDKAAGSIIGEARFDKTLQIRGWQKSFFPLLRAWYKITDSFGKRYGYWSAWPRDLRRKI